MTEPAYMSLLDNYSATNCEWDAAEPTVVTNSEQEYNTKVIRRAPSSSSVWDYSINPPINDIFRSPQDVGDSMIGGCRAGLQAQGIENP